jgi:hypothetical protein
MQIWKPGDDGGELFRGSKQGAKKIIFHFDATEWVLFKYREETMAYETGLCVHLKLRNSTRKFTSSEKRSNININTS